MSADVLRNPAAVVAEAMGLERPYARSETEGAEAMARARGDEDLHLHRDEDLHLLDDGAALLDELHDALTRYVVLPSPEAATAVVLWIAATHAQPSWQHATRLVINSPEKRCGKSRLLDVIEATCHRPLVAFNATVSALYRSIDEHDPPALLLDEADAIWSAKKTTDGAEDLRALVNAGFGRGRPVLRCVGPQQTPTPFASFAMAALAGIGDCVPDTVTDRAVRVTMRRRTTGEQVEAFRHRRDALPLHELRDRLNGWVRDHLDELADAEPESPLEDRAADTWEPLLAVADLAGGPWPSRARNAALVMTSEADESAVDASLGLQLLHDLQQVFAAEKVSVIASEELVRALHGLPESPWAGFDLDQRGLARRLKQYGIRPCQVRPDGTKQVRGYKLEDALDSFTRYLPGGPSIAVTASQPQVSPVTDTPAVTDASVTHSETVTGLTSTSDGVTPGDGGPGGHTCPVCGAAVRPSRNAVERGWPTYCRPCGEVAS